MDTTNESAPAISDPAAVFACALSLWQACQKLCEAEPNLNFSEAYNGIDQFMREIMRVATFFEEWSCEHIDFTRFSDAWPYMLEKKFGEACLTGTLPTALASFDASDCLRVALHLQLPVALEGKLPVPVDVIASNPLAASPFKKLRIRTMRDAVDGSFSAPYTSAEDPFDEEYGPPYFGLYGIAEDGLDEHIADRRTFADAVSLAQKLSPGIEFS